MLITSKFHDYYDGVAKSKGIDKTIVYNRQTTEVEVHDQEIPKLLEWKTKEIDTENNTEIINTFKAGFVGFCGTLYAVGISEVQSAVKSDNTTTSVTHGLEPVYDAFFALRLSQVEKENKKSAWRQHLSPFYYREYEEVFVSKRLCSLFQQFKVPIFCSKNLVTENYDSNDRQKIILNPSLKPFEFAKVIDPFVAFQEIEMYLSGVLGIGEREVVDISDRDRLQGHGFDNTWSFRRENHPRKKEKES